MTRLAAGILLAHVGCAPSVADLEIPSIDGMVSAILSTGPETPGSVPALTALSTPGGLPLPSVSESSSVWHLLVYSQKLERLGLEPGPLLHAPPSEGGPLPLPDRVLRREPNATWTSLDRLPEPLSNFRIRTLNRLPCPEIEVERLRLEGAEGDGRVLVPLDSTRAFIGTQEGQFYLYDDGEIVPLTELWKAAPSQHGVRGADGSIWLLDEHELARIDPTDFRIVSTSSVPIPDVGPPPLEDAVFTENEPFVWLGGPGPGVAPFELFALFESGHLVRFDGEQWSIVVQGHPRARFAWGGSLLWLGPGEVLTQGPHYPLPVHARGHAVEELTLPMAGKPSALALTSIGVVAGSLAGELAVWADDRKSWRNLIRDTGPTVAVLAPLGEGILHGGVNGVLRQFRPTFGPCEAEIIAGVSHVTILAAVGERVLGMTNLDGELFVLREAGWAR